MSLNRRDFMRLLAMAGAAGMSLNGRVFADAAVDYDAPAFGNLSLMHFTDCHAQLMPVYFREPNFNVGIGEAFGKPPHVVGDHFLKHFGIAPGSANAHAFTFLEFEAAARKYGKVGGFAHLATLVKRLRASRPNSLLMDGGDTWQGSATALWTKGQDMVDACKLLGVDIMTGHWEFTYGIDRVSEIVNEQLAPIEFLAQNVVLTEDAAFEGKPA
ncbi:MAG: twin-arginine translocation signal domain-containing protein, partial [Arenicellales bacterium]